MKVSVLTRTCLAALVFICSFGVQAGTAEDVRRVVEENMAATQSEDMPRMMATIHRDSPSYRATRQQVAPLFQQYDLAYTLDRYEFVGMTGEFAVVRVHQTTEKVSGQAAFNDNRLQLLQAFKKEDGQWKFWSQSILDIEFQ